ncbi:hypothetical protein [Indiicoccus explosivorum]|uniref:hypothetical protein n=1 Tax=Indiicoccus explosivorum TaxID=1917864 RepID=UPI000B43C44E|nr:hypothetical protein [Indiicoccus explosivorum]
MARNALLILSLLIALAAGGYAVANASSPTQSDSEMQVAAVNTGLNEDGDAVVKVFFTFDLDKKQIWPRQHMVQIKWTEGWDLASYNLMENGRYENQDIPAVSPEGLGYLDVPLEPERHLDGQGRGQGYFILTSGDKDIIRQRVNSSVSVGFYYQSFVKEFKLADSTAWNNLTALGFY